MLILLVCETVAWRDHERGTVEPDHWVYTHSSATQQLLDREQIT